MAVPASGELKLWDTLWNQELLGSQGENSLHSASIYAGFSTPDALSDFYGWSDVEIPSVSTQAATSVGAYSMVANGNVTDDGNQAVSRGFYFGTAANPYSSNTKYTNSGTQNEGAFSRTMTGLNYNTTYYYWAFACNDAGEAQGGRVSQITSLPPFSPSIAGCLCLIGLASHGFGPKNVSIYWRNPYSNSNNLIVGQTANYYACMCFTNSATTALMSNNTSNLMQGTTSGCATEFENSYLVTRACVRNHTFSSTSVGHGGQYFCYAVVDSIDAQEWNAGGEHGQYNIHSGGYTNGIQSSWNMYAYACYS